MMKFLLLKALAGALMLAAGAAGAQDDGAREKASIAIEVKDSMGRLAMSPLILAWGQKGEPKEVQSGSPRRSSVMIPVGEGARVRWQMPPRAHGSLFVAVEGLRLDEQGALVRLGYDLETHGEALYRSRARDLTREAMELGDGAGALVDAKRNMVVMRDASLRSAKWPGADEQATRLPGDGSWVKIAQGQGFVIEASLRLEP